MCNIGNLTVIQFNMLPVKQNFIVERYENTCLFIERKVNLFNQCLLSMQTIASFVSLRQLSNKFTKEPVRLTLTLVYVMMLACSNAILSRYCTLTFPTFYVDFIIHYLLAKQYSKLYLTGHL